jgi:hypothetical protein
MKVERVSGESLYEVARSSLFSHSVREGRTESLGQRNDGCQLAAPGRRESEMHDDSYFA